MTFLPIVDRELRVAARRRSTYWLRTGVAAGVIAICVWVFLLSLGAAPHMVGQRIFYVLTGGALLYCLLTGVGATADCLSEEKREGTLGLLFLTDLKGYDVVGGKLVASSLNAVYGLLAIVPVLAVPLLMGGVTAGEFARMAAVLVDALFLSLSVGLFVSALCRPWQTVAALTFLLMLVFTAGFPLLGEWVNYKMESHQLALVCCRPSAGYAYMMALDFNFKSNPADFYWSMATIHALGWIFFGLACLIAPQSWQDRPASLRTAPLRAVWQAWNYGAADGRREFRRRLLEQNPFYWLAARARLKPAWLWFVLAALACGWLWAALKWQRDWLNEGVYIATALTLNVLLKLGVAAEAGRQLGEDRAGSTLELLLSTPLTVPEILRGQRLALQRQFLGPLALTLLAEVAMMIAGSGEMQSSGDLSAWLWLWAAGVVMLVADLVTLYWVGLWLGLSAKNPKRASGLAVVRVLVLPWIGFVAFLTIAGLASPRQEPIPEVLIGVWFGLGLITDLWFGVWSRHHLLTRFREVAAQRYQPRASFWRRLLGNRAETVGAVRPRSVT